MKSYKVQLARLTKLQAGVLGVNVICKTPGCLICAILDCPFDDPDHYHKGGCPSCTCRTAITIQAQEGTQDAKAS